MQSPHPGSREKTNWHELHTLKLHTHTKKDHKPIYACWENMQEPHTHEHSRTRTSTQPNIDTSYCICKYVHIHSQCTECAHRMRDKKINKMEYVFVIIITTTAFESDLILFYLLLYYYWYYITLILHIIRFKLFKIICFLCVTVCSFTMSRLYHQTLCTFNVPLIMYTREEHLHKY